MLSVLTGELPLAEMLNFNKNTKYYANGHSSDIAEAWNSTN